MSDASLSLLFPLLRAQQAPALWAVDEHAAGVALPAPNPQVTVVSNRFDVATALQGACWSAQFSDFDFAALPDGSLDALFLRLAKEKPVNHHVINEAARLLVPGGRLYLAGTKQQGLKTYAKHAAERLGVGAGVKKHGNDYLAVIGRGSRLGVPLDDRDYAALRPAVTDGDLTFHTKPGLYGWDQVDEGSALLVQHLSQFVSAPPQSVFDLGCGYGYLSLHAWRQWRPQRIVATDNNAAALLACRRNFDVQGIAGEVLAGDCADGIDGGFELVLCNPPFHQGFGVERDLTERFVAAARRLVARGGTVAFVTNAFLPIERVAQGHFGRVEPVAATTRFKLTRMRP